TVEGGTANVADVYPLAPLQEGLLFHHLLADGGDDAYVLPSVLEFPSREQLDAFTDALQQVIDRHDIFRTSFVWEGLREPVQVVWRKAVLPVVELTLDAQGTDPVAELVAAVGSSLALGRAPLFSFHAAAVPGGERWLGLVRVHHLVQDHTALEVLLGEVGAFLTGRGGDLPAPLPFRTFVAHARSGNDGAAHEQYFAELLGDVTEPTAPYGLVDIHGAGSDVVREVVPFAPASGARLREVARRLGVSTATVLHVAWARALAAVSGRDDVVFGTILFGRMNAGVGADRVPGPLINTLPVRVRTAELGVLGAVTAMRDQLAHLLEHEHAPLAVAQGASGIAGEAPLFTALFNYRHNTGGNAAEETGENPTGAQVSDADGIRLVFSRERTNYPLAVAVDDDGDRGLSLAVDALASIDGLAVGVLVRTAAENLVSALEVALDGGPEVPLSALQVLDEAGLDRVVREWNDTAVEVGSSSLSGLFEAQVGRTPGAVAVVFEGAEVSYAELDARANRLARLLVSRGVGAESVVGVALERGVDMVVALLAVVKAGGAYLPIDPEYPSERVAFMLEDAAPVAVVTSQALAARVLPDSVAASVVVLDDAATVAELAAAEGGALSDAERRGEVLPSHPVYVIYTSGSTGRPK
ncbi:condensation domain-containing protein, partial [Streptomyces avidinii]|uniref:condensation domain-containing protein n=1 Tax=Streptomyces avidinii TaxID=1895 RepID=UPI0016734C28